MPVSCVVCLCPVPVSYILYRVFRPVCNACMVSFVYPLPAAVPVGSHVCALCPVCLHQECQGRPGGGSLPGGPGLLPLPTPSSGTSAQQQQQQQEALLLLQVQQQQLQQQYVDEGYGDDEVPGVTFKMLMKRGGKDDRTKELHVSGAWRTDWTWRVEGLPVKSISVGCSCRPCLRCCDV